MASSLADHHHMIKRENNIVDHHHHSVHHIHDEEDMEEDDTSNPFEEVSTSPVFGHNLRSSSRNLYSIPSISITMSSHHPVKRDVNLSASACLDDLVHGSSQKRNGIDSNGSNVHSGDNNGQNHQNTSNSVRHRNLSCLNGRNRHRSSPSTALERYCESPSTFLLDHRHAVSDFPCGNSDDEEGSNHTLNGGRSNSRLSEGTDEILFHSSVLGDTSQHSSMLRDVSVVTPTIETVVSTLIPGRDVVVHGSGVNGGVVGSDVVIKTSGRAVSSSEVIVSSDCDVTEEEMAEIVSGEDVIVTTTAPSVTMTVLRTCSSSPTTSSRNCIEQRIVEPSSTGGSILRNQLLQGSSTTTRTSAHQQQLVDDGDDMCILKEPPLNHYNSNQSFVSSDTSPLSSVSTNASMVICGTTGHKSVVASSAMVSLPGLVTSSQHHQADGLQMTASALPMTISSSINPPSITSLQHLSTAQQQQLSKSDIVTVSTTGSGQQPQPLDIKILPAGLIQLASNLAAVFPSSAIQSKQIAIQLLREDGTSFILPITTVTSRCQNISGHSTVTLSSAPIMTSPSLGKSSNVTAMISPSNVISSSTGSVATTILPQAKTAGLKNGNKSASGMKVVTSSSSAVKSTNSIVVNGTQVTIGQQQQSLLATVQQQSSGATVQSSTTESERPFKCELCSSTFTRLGNYTRHKKIHSLPTKVTAIRFKSVYVY